jgi:hypothetical protein
MEEKIRKLFRNPKSLSYEIFMYLGAHLDDPIYYVSTLSRRLKRNYNTIMYHILKFREAGLMDDWLGFTNKGKKLFEFLWDGKETQMLRAHNIQVNLTLSACPVTFVERYGEDKVFTIITNKKYRGLKGEIELEFGKVGLMIYSRKKAVCVLTDVFGKSLEDIKGAYCSMIPKIIEAIETKFPGIKIDKWKPARIQTSHIAIINSIIAERFDLDGATYEGKDVAIDKSHGILEAELTNPKNNLSGIDFLKGIEHNLLSQRDKIRNNLTKIDTLQRGKTESDQEKSKK